MSDVFSDPEERSEVPPFDALVASLKEIDVLAATWPPSDRSPAR